MKNTKELNTDLNFSNELFRQRPNRLIRYGIGLMLVILVFSIYATSFFKISEHVEIEYIQDYDSKEINIGDTLKLNIKDFNKRDTSLSFNLVSAEIALNKNNGGLWGGTIVDSIENDSLVHFIVESHSGGTCSSYTQSTLIMKNNNVFDLVLRPAFSGIFDRRK